MVLCRSLLMLSVAISGCGYSADHALDIHQQKKVTESKLNVVTGSVYSPTGRPVSLGFNGQSFKVLTKQQRNNFDVVSDYPLALHQLGFLDDDDSFYFQNAVSKATVSAAFDGYTLYSFYQGTPIPKTDVTITQEFDWHGSNKLTLQIGTGWPLSTISINPFSNLAYWLGGGPVGTYASYSKARAKINKDLKFDPVVPECWFEVKLCKDQKDFFTQGNTVTVHDDQFTITMPGKVCTGYFKDYTSATSDKELCP
jgi:hypothetical protein